MNLRFPAAGAALCILLAACNAPQDTDQSAPPAAPKAEAGTVPSTADTAPQAQTESARLNAWFQQKFDEGLARSPMRKTYLGIKDADYGKWDDPSPEHALEDHQIAQANLAQMHALFDYDKLDDAAKLSWRLYDYNGRREAAAWRFHDYTYIFNQMFGAQSSIPAFLINQHQIRSASDATAYISRLNGIKHYLDIQIANSARRFEKGIYPPSFVYDRVLDAARNVIKGAPFDDGPASPLLADFKAKLDKLVLDDAVKAGLLRRAKAALIDAVEPAYDDLITEMERQQALAGNDDGVWKLPDGDAYYADRLVAMTTTDMGAGEIHALGLSEVSRIHAQMLQIMQKVGFKGSLQEFFKFMREDKQFYYPASSAGRQAYLKRAVSLIDDMRTHLDELFLTKPRADVIIKAVEPFREATAGKAFYQQPALDGSRPGIVYVNLYRMNSMPRYQMDALLYHEGIPGHHMQIAIAQELKGVPMFRKTGSYTAYVEGWALYAERVPKEMGLYADPYADFGRLAMELWRAARLVVDTGLHDKHWSRQKAIDYLVQNTPNSVDDCTNAIERYIVMPGQATAYKIGMLEILKLRHQAKKELGDGFDIREFHDVILANGAVPLTVLDDLVRDWIKSKKKR